MTSCNFGAGVFAASGGDPVDAAFDAWWAAECFVFHRRPSDFWNAVALIQTLAHRTRAALPATRRIVLIRLRMA